MDSLKSKVNKLTKFKSKVLHGGSYLNGPVPDISLGKLIYNNLLHWKNENLPALINAHNGKKLFSQDLLHKACGVANALEKNGCGPGTFISISSENNLDFFIPSIATFFVGAHLSTINNNYTLLELEHALNITKPKIIFCSYETSSKFIELKRKLCYVQKIVVIGEQKINGSKDIKNLEDFIEITDEKSVKSFNPVDVNIYDHIAIVLCSSGTTGLPKGVMLTHRNIISLFIQFHEPRWLLPNTRPLCVVPFYHAYGFFTTLMSILVQNQPVTFLTKFQETEYLKAIETYQITKLYLVPPLVTFLSSTPLFSRYNLSSVKSIFTGGAPLNPNLENALYERFDRKILLQQAYGLTEITFACSVSKIEGKKIGSSGHLVPGTTVMIRDIKTGKPVGTKELGEICIKSDTVMKGYIGNEKATKETFTSDGWLLTGDVGYFDDDEELFVVDRIKELIKYKGFQVAPVEVEQTLLKHPEIIDAAVIGVPDVKAGELPLAFVVKTSGSNLTEVDVQKFIKDLLSPTKWLRGGVVFVNTIPKNPTGKILRKELRKLVTMKNISAKM